MRQQYGAALPSQIKEVKELRRAGVKLIRIAEQLDLSYNRVRYLSIQRESRKL